MPSNRKLTREFLDDEQEILNELDRIVAWSEMCKRAIYGGLGENEVYERAMYAAKHARALIMRCALL